MKLINSLERVSVSYYSKRKVCLLTILKDAEGSPKLRASLLRYCGKKEESKYADVYATFAPWVVRAHIYDPGISYEYVQIGSRLICLLTSRTKYQTLRSNSMPCRSNSSWSLQRYIIPDNHKISCFNGFWRVIYFFQIWRSIGFRIRSPWKENQTGCS